MKNTLHRLNPWLGAILVTPLIAACISGGNDNPATATSGLNDASTPRTAENAATLNAQVDPVAAIPASESVQVTAPLMAAMTEVQCINKSPLLGIGSGKDAAVQSTPENSDYRNSGQAAINSAACFGNTAFQMGSGIADITGSAGGSITTGYENPEHQTQGIHTRLYSRAFALHSPCNGKRVLIAIVDNAFITQAVRQGVMQAIAADPELKSLYGQDNVMLSATHTHSAPGGDAHDTSYNAFRLGFDDLHYRIYVNGIVKSLKAAHRNMVANPVAGKIGLASGDLLDTNVNRSIEPFRENPGSERQSWKDVKGRELDVNKKMVLLRFVRDDGTQPGLLNWFGVHTTSLGIHVPAIASDNKGFAALTAERIMNTRYGATRGENTFVAAFAQSDEGDSSPNLCFDSSPFPSIRIGCGKDTEESNAASGMKQLKRALQLYDAATQAVTGGISSQTIHVDMTRIEIKDTEILKRLKHPTALDSAVKRTCSGGAGVSFGAGAEDNRGHTEEGVSCSNQDQVDKATRDVQSARDNLTQGYYDVPPFLLSNALCAANATPRGGDYSCHAEKPVLFPISSNVLPIQLMTIGNVAILGLPYEVTTSSARRLRQLMLDTLRDAGINRVVIAGLTNDYANYLATREEYSLQHYEGASTLFGPWTLAAVMQESRRLAVAMRDGQMTEKGSPRVTTPELPRPPQLIADIPAPTGQFGAVITDAKSSYKRGEKAVARFQGGHPRNDTEAMLERSYATVERQTADGKWVAFAHDRLPEVQFRWFPRGNPQASLASESEVSWAIPLNAPAGRYRLKHEGSAKQAGIGAALPYMGVSTPFEITGPLSQCP